MRSYAAMKIGYCGATMTLDLLDRKNKYSNGFCHWPVPAWVTPSGEFVPSKTNFTSLADPTAVGSGLTALNTLMHEAGAYVVSFRISLFSLYIVLYPHHSPFCFLYGQDMRHILRILNNQVRCLVKNVPRHR